MLTLVIALLSCIGVIVASLLNHRADHHGRQDRRRRHDPLRRRADRRDGAARGRAAAARHRDRGRAHPGRGHRRRRPGSRRSGSRRRLKAPGGPPHGRAAALRVRHEPPSSWPASASRGPAAAWRRTRASTACTSIATRALPSRSVHWRGSIRPAKATAWPLTRCSAANAACASQRIEVDVVRLAVVAAAAAAGDRHSGDGGARARGAQLRLAGETAISGEGEHCVLRGLRVVELTQPAKAGGGPRCEDNARASFEPVRAVDVSRQQLARRIVFRRVRHRPCWARQRRHPSSHGARFTTCRAADSTMHPAS